MGKKERKRGVERKEGKNGRRKREQSHPVSILFGRYDLPGVIPSRNMRD